MGEMILSSKPNKDNTAEIHSTFNDSMNDGICSLEESRCNNFQEKDKPEIRCGGKFRIEARGSDWHPARLHKILSQEGGQSKKILS